MMLSFHWYGLIVGLALASFLWQWEWWLQRKIKLPEKKIVSAWVLLTIGSLIGARAYHLVTDWPLYQNQSWITWIQINQGGIGLLGGIMGGLGGLYLWYRWQKPAVSWLTLVDAAALSLPVAQMLGRWGNFVNQEIFGPPTNAWWGIYIDPLNRPAEFAQATHFHPLFLYESLALLIVACWLYGIYRYFHHTFSLGTGHYAAWYLISYGSIRLSLEWLRLNSALGWFGLTIAQWVCIGFIVIGIWLLPRSWKLAYNG